MSSIQDPLSYSPIDTDRNIQSLMNDPLERDTTVTNWGISPDDGLLSEDFRDPFNEESNLTMNTILDLDMWEEENFDATLFEEFFPTR